MIDQVNTEINLEKTNFQKYNEFINVLEPFIITKRIQNFIISKNNPAIPGLDIHASYIPVESVGGDFYDFHFIDKNKIGVFIADVSGHGAPAALLASTVKIAFSMQKEYASDPLKLMTEMDNKLRNKLDYNFVTSCYAFIDLEKGMITTSNGGHEPLLIFKRKEKRIYELKPKGGVIGILPKNYFTTEKLKIESGDRIILYTDGIIESMNNSKEIFGMENLINIILQNSDLSVSELSGLLLKSVSDWSIQNTFRDDLTLLIMDVK